jgi:hypothetical protein
MNVMRSYQGYYTRSHQNSEVKRLWAGIVLGWVTSREVPVLHPVLVQFRTKIIRFPDEKVHALIVDTRNQGYPEKCIPGTGTAKVHTRTVHARNSTNPKAVQPPGFCHDFTAGELIIIKMEKGS